MKELNFDTGLVTYKLNDTAEVTFNPTDSAFVERLFKTFDALDKKRIFYPDYDAIPQEHWQEAVEKCLWFINGSDAPDGHKSPRLVDWDQDYHLVIAPVNRALRHEARAMEYLHWWTFLAAYQEIGDCTFAQVVRIRDRLARGMPLDKQDNGTGKTSTW